ncbi:MAG: hypothetical protein V4478_03650 [Patescibacteria group bacterium]
MKIEFKGYYFIVTSNAIVRQLGRMVSLGTNAMGITVYPFIFVRTDTRGHEGLVRHETVHIRQQLELLLVGAILLFIVEYIYARFIKRLDARQTYYYSAMEQEAHRNTKNTNYLNERKPYAVLKYIWDKKWIARGPAGELIEKDF